MYLGSEASLEEVIKYSTNIEEVKKAVLDLAEECQKLSNYLDLSIKALNQIETEAEEAESHLFEEVIDSVRETAHKALQELP